MVSELYLNRKYRPHGHKYIGEWENGKQHGKGVFISKSGTRREGEWFKG